jgi:2-methylcitrate dehydratase PrpD
MSVTETLAKFAIESSPAILSGDVVASAKLKFLDTIAVMIKGARHPSATTAQRVAQRMGGNPAATSFVDGGKTSSPLAGFVNGVAAHALEYDDNTRGVGHASVCLVPGCMAVAEEAGASGRAMLEAFAIGFEITARIAKGLRPALIDNGWHPIGIVGGQGVAVAACRLLGLDVPTTRMAMGIMASSGGGVRKNVGTMGKAFHVGHGVRSGIFAAQLAQEGFTVDPDIIEGADGGGEGHQRFGLADTFSGIGKYRLHLMVEDLGGTLEVARNTTMVRMHPGSTAPSSTVDGVIALAKEHAIDPAQVEELVAELTPQCVAIAPYAEPSDEHRAKFCLPYTLAVALIDRQVLLAQYAPERIAAPDVRALMPRIRIELPDDLKHHRGQWGENGINWGESRITLKLKDGRVLRRDAPYSRGWPEDPVTWDDVKAKYSECADGVLSNAQVAETVDMIGGLERLDKVSELVGALTAKSKHC